MKPTNTVMQPGSDRLSATIKACLARFGFRSQSQIEAEAKAAAGDARSEAPKPAFPDIRTPG